MASESQSAKRLSLALLAPGEIFGGAERQMLTLCKWLASRGVQIRVILFHDATLAAMLREAHIEPLILPGTAAFSGRAARRLREVLMQERFDVLHFHGYKASVHACIAIGAARRVAVVKTEHGMVETSDRSPAERAKTLLYRWLDTFCTRRMRPEIVYVTHDLQQRFASEHRGLSCSVIYNGIDLQSAAHTQRPSAYAPTKRNLLVLGRLEQVKGIEYAIRALCEAAMPPDILLHIVGDGPLRADLERLAQQLGVGDRALFHGFRSNAHAYMAHADALLMPSLHEGLPYVLLEAMSLEVPLIAAAVGGLKEVLDDGSTALLVPAQDPGALAAAVCRLFESPALRDRITSEGRQLLQRQFSADAMGEQYLARYRVAREATRA